VETSAVRQAVQLLLHQIKRPAADRREHRRVQTDEAAREYEMFLRGIAVPLFKQVADVLRAEGYPVDLFTPGRSVRLTFPRGNDNYVEIALDTSGAAPKLLGRATHSRNGDVTETELVLNATANIKALTDDDVLGFVLSTLEPFL
jgi:hypothetical protein